MTADLPNGWQWSTLGETCAVVGGSTPKTAVADFWGGSVAWVTPDDLSRHDSIGVRSGARSLTEEGFRSISAPMLPPGTVLFSSRAPIGYAAIVEAPLCTNQGFKSVVPPTGIESRFLYWYLRYATPLIESMASGTTFREISKRRMQDVPLALPPTAEQERIVAAVEEHLSRLDAAEASLRSGETRLDRLRGRLVDEAVTGTEVPLGSLLREPLRNGLSARASADGSVRVATLTAVTRGEFIDKHTKMIEPGARFSDDLWMEPGDLFIQRSNTPDLVGTAALYSGQQRWAIFPDLLIRVRTNGEVVPEYLELVLRSEPLRRYFRGAAQGIAGSMPKISQPIVEAAAVPLPDRATQLAILERATIQAEALDRVRAELQEAKTRARALRRSILAAAFAGQLVPQDPSDEPASVLLERIRAEREAAGSRRRSRA